MRGAVIVLAAGALALGAALAVAVADEGEVREEALSWRQVAIADGASMYAELCAACHGVRGAGDGPAAAAFKGPIPDLTGLAEANGGVYPSDEVARAINGERRIVAHGSGEMPVWGRALYDTRPERKSAERYFFAQDRIDALTAHLETLQEGSG